MKLSYEAIQGFLYGEARALDEHRWSDWLAHYADDIEFFRELATFLTEHTSAGTRVDLVGVVQQVERALVDELDYRTEARNAAQFRKALAVFPHILIPRVIDAYTTHKVLTTERIRGVKIDDIPPISRIEYDFTQLAIRTAPSVLALAFFRDAAVLALRVRPPVNLQVPV